MAAYSRVGTLKAPLKFCIAACETPALFKRAPKYPVNKAQFFELRMLYGLFAFEGVGVVGGVGRVVAG